MKKNRIINFFEVAALKCSCCGKLGQHIDKSKNIYITGSTDTEDFPVTKGAIIDYLTGFHTIFVSKLSNDGTKFKIEIKEVATLDEALLEFTGKAFRKRKTNITISRNYADTMKELAIQLCSRSTKLRNQISTMIQH